MTLAVFTKTLSTQTVVLDTTSVLASPTETLSGTPTVVTVSPTSTTPLTVSVITVSSNVVTLSLSGGEDTKVYGVQLSFQTNLGRTFQDNIAVNCQLSSVTPHKNPSDNLGYRAMLDEVTAGESVLGTATFILPLSTDATNGQISWSLISTDGTLFGSGGCHEYSVSPSSFANTVRGSSVIPFPSDLYPSNADTKYQIRWKLSIPGQSDQYSYESIRVLTQVSVPLGSSDTVEVAGDPATIFLTLPKTYDNVSYEIYRGNSKIATGVAGKPDKVSSGWTYRGVVNTSTFIAGLEPYQISWKYFDQSSPNFVNRDSARLFVLTPSQINAVEDVKSKVSKARTTMSGMPDMLFDVPTVVAWLRRGSDMFNAAGGFITTFDMTNASVGIREFWLQYAEVDALRAQALAEGEKSFNFQGQEISLDVDKSQYYTSLADAIQARLDTEIGPFKRMLTMKGITSGDGSMTNMNGNTPKLGMSIHPLTRFPGRIVGRRW